MADGILSVVRVVVVECWVDLDAAALASHQRKTLGPCNHLFFFLLSTSHDV